MTTDIEAGGEPISPPPLPSIHEAVLASGPSGAVEYGAEIDFVSAVSHRRRGDNVVVRGDDVDANRRLANSIESAVGVCRRNDPHRSAGSYALPPYQPQSRPPDGHTFYETPRRKARKSP
jgi:hypothetical protein